MIERCYQALAEAIDPEAGALGVDEFLDVLWLALRIGPPAGASLVATGAETAPDLVPPPAEGAAQQPVAAPPAHAAPDTRARMSPLPPPRDDPDSRRFPVTPKGTPGGVPISAVAPPALRQTRELTRTMRPLIRKVASRSAAGIDEEATSRRVAEERIWDIVLKPRPEPWLDLVVLVDQSASMQLWRRTVDELRRLLEMHGAFRSVTTLGLNTGADRPWLRRLVSLDAAGAHGQIRGLINPGRSRLILIISDCIGPAWRGRGTYRLLATLGAAHPVAIVQMLPEHLWDRTALGHFDRVLIELPRPGVPNRQMVPLPLDWSGPPAAGVPVPVITANPVAAGTFAAALAGRGGHAPIGVVVPRPPPGRPTQKLADDEDVALLVRQFLAAARPPARELARALALVPVTLPVIYLVASEVRPAAGPAEIAEVFISGLLQARHRPEVHPDEVRYDFAPGARGLLAQGVTRAERERLLLKVGARMLGLQSSTRFAAMVQAVRELAAHEQADDGSFVREFALLTARSLRLFGGAWATEQAGLIEASAAPAPPPKPNAEPAALLESLLATELPPAAPVTQEPATPEPEALAPARRPPIADEPFGFARLKLRRFLGDRSPAQFVREAASAEGAYVAAYREQARLEDRAAPYPLDPLPPFAEPTSLGAQQIERADSRLTLVGDELQELFYQAQRPQIDFGLFSSRDWLRRTERVSDNLRAIGRIHAVAGAALDDLARIPAATAAQVAAVRAAAEEARARTEALRLRRLAGPALAEAAGHAAAAEAALRRLPPIPDVGPPPIEQVVAALAVVEEWSPLIAADLGRLGSWEQALGEIDELIHASAEGLLANRRAIDALAPNIARDELSQKLHHHADIHEALVVRRAALDAAHLPQVLATARELAKRLHGRKVNTERAGRAAETLAQLLPRLDAAVARATDLIERLAAARPFPVAWGPALQHLTGLNATRAILGGLGTMREPAAVLADTERAREATSSVELLLVELDAIAKAHEQLPAVAARPAFRFGEAELRRLRGIQQRAVAIDAAGWPDDWRAASLEADAAQFLAQVQGTLPRHGESVPEQRVAQIVADLRRLELTHERLMRRAGLVEVRLGELHQALSDLRTEAQSLAGDLGKARATLSYAQGKSLAGPEARIVAALGQAERARDQLDAVAARSLREAQQSVEGATEAALSACAELFNTRATSFRADLDRLGALLTAVEGTAKLSADPQLQDYRMLLDVLAASKIGTAGITVQRLTVQIARMHETATELQKLGTQLSPLQTRVLGAAAKLQGLQQDAKVRLDDLRIAGRRRWPPAEYDSKPIERQLEWAKQSADELGKAVRVDAFARQVEQCTAFYEACLGLIAAEGKRIEQQRESIQRYERLLEQWEKLLNSHITAPGTTTAAQVKIRTRLRDIRSRRDKLKLSRGLTPQSASATISAIWDDARHPLILEQTPTLRILRVTVDSAERVQVRIDSVASGGPKSPGR